MHNTGVAILPYWKFNLQKIQHISIIKDEKLENKSFLPEIKIIK